MLVPSASYTLTTNSHGWESFNSSGTCIVYTVSAIKLSLGPDRWLARETGQWRRNVNAQRDLCHIEAFLQSQFYEQYKFQLSCCDLLMLVDSFLMNESLHHVMCSIARLICSAVLICCHRCHRSLHSLRVLSIANRRSRAPH